MKARRLLLVSFLTLASVSSLLAHTTDSDGAPLDKEALCQHILDEFMAKRRDLAKSEEEESVVARLPERTEVAAGFSAFDLAALLGGMPTLPPPGYGSLMAEMNEETGAKRLRIIRSEMLCCDTHSRQCSVALEFAGKVPSFMPMSWVKLEGLLSCQREGVQTVPVILVDAIAATRKPANAMMR